MNDTGNDLFAEVSKFLPEDYMAEWEVPMEGEDLIDWSLRVHNRMNKKKGDWDRWDRTDFGIAHKPECDFCADKEYVFLYPWGFIHAVASTEHADALAFLKAFSAAYPAECCRGTFFTDDPADGESVYDWTIRHHKRFNVAHGREEMQYVPLPPQPAGASALNDITMTGCVGCPDATATTD
jgi:hypothetical protein